MAGGGGFSKKVLNYVLDNPVRVYLVGGAFFYAVRKYQTATTYNYHFGKFDFQRKVERGQLH